MKWRPSIITLWNTVCLGHLRAVIGSLASAFMASVENSGSGIARVKKIMKHHFDRGSDNDFDDPSGWNRASYNHHRCDDIEPI